MFIPRFSVTRGDSAVPPFLVLGFPMEQRQADLEREHERLLQRLDKRLEQTKAELEMAIDGTRWKNTPAKHNDAKQEPLTPTATATPFDRTLSNPGMYNVIQKPVKYDGRTPWESYLAQFDIASQINGWDEEEKATFLSTSLTGPALAVLGNLTAEKRTNYKALVSALTARFGSTHQAELAEIGPADHRGHPGGVVGQPLP